jgi:trk system potassium uptake protein TrkA
MRTIQVPDLWDKGGLSIAHLPLPEELIAGLIKRKTADGELILIPNGADHILPGDQVTVVGEAKVMHQLHQIFRSKSNKVKSVMLAGGSSVAIHLSNLLLEQKIDVRLIEKDLSRAELLAELLPGATIINRDGRDPQILKSEQVQLADAFIACTHFDETNLLIGGLAKKFGAEKVIAQVTSKELVPIFEKLGVIPALSPRVAVANRILSILDEETTLSVRSLSADAAKIVELKISPSSKAIGVPLSDLKLPKGILIAVIESSGKVLIGRGNRVLYPDDIVIAICSSAQIPVLQGLLH